MIVEVSKLSKQYRRGGRLFMAVDQVDFQIAAGDYVTIIGRSGSGKSTFLNMLAGMLTPTAGRIKIAGQELSGKTDRQISFLRNDLIGFIPQGTATLPNLTILDNVALPYFLYAREGDPFGKAQLLLDKLGIGKLASSYPKELSGGELRRTLIARALMNSPKLLIADEPTADLDIENTTEVMKLFTQINQEGTTLIVVSHELDTLMYGKQTYTMLDGKLQAGKRL